jgi:hypothetical protein
MAGRPRKEPRQITTVNLNVAIITWFKTQPRSFQIQDWINDVLLKSIKETQAQEKIYRVKELEQEIYEKTEALNNLRAEEDKKRAATELKQKAEAQYNAELQEINNLKSTLDYFAGQSQEHRNFVKKLEFENQETLPLNKIDRYRVMVAMLNNACQNGQGKELMQRIMQKVV